MSFSKNLNFIILFIPYFRLLVFGILVTLVAWFSFCFFPSCPSCLAKCKQRLCNIFISSSPKVTKNEKWDERNKGCDFTKHFAPMWYACVKNFFSSSLRRYPKRLRTLWWSAIHLDKPTCHGDCPTMAKAHFWPST